MSVRQGTNDVLGHPHYLFLQIFPEVKREEQREPHLAEQNEKNEISLSYFSLLRPKRRAEMRVINHTVYLTDNDSPRDVRSTS